MPPILTISTGVAVVMFEQPVYTVSEDSASALIVVQFSGTLDSSFTVNVIGQSGTL